MEALMTKGSREHAAKTHYGTKTPQPSTIHLNETAVIITAHWAELRMLSKALCRSLPPECTL